MKKYIRYKHGQRARKGMGQHYHIATHRRNYGGQASNKVREILRKGRFDVDPYAKSYINALEESEAMAGEQGVKTQALYIYGNLRAKNPQQKLAKQQLLDYGQGKQIREKVEAEPKNILSELQLENISDDFEEWSSKRKKSMPEEEQEGHKIPLSWFKEFAKARDYDVDKVLKANPWIDEVLDDDVLVAKKKAEKKIRVPEWE